MNPLIDNYLKNGCGRCKYGGTPDCKVHNWTEDLVQLRKIMLECGLTEDLKWSMPCYTYQNKNIAIISAFKEFCSINFLKGSLLNDTENILTKAGDNSNIARQLRYTDVNEIRKQKATIIAYIFEAIEIEKAGLKVKPTKVSELEIPMELQNKFKESPTFRNAFKTLTPGRQKGYIYYFSQAKQSKTRKSRIEKFIPHIFAGKGYQE